MCVMREKKFGTNVDADCAGDVQANNGGEKNADIPQLISRHQCIEVVAGDARAVLFARAQQPQVIGEERPSDRRINRAEHKPTLGIS